MKVVVVRQGLIGATCFRGLWEGLRLNEHSAPGNLLASLPQNPVFYQAAVEVATVKHVRHVSAALLAKVRAWRKLSGAQQPGKMVFNEGIQLISVHICNLATV